MTGEWVADTLAAMTLEEKISLLAGRDLWETVPIPRLGLPALKVTDGPNGARGADVNHGPSSTSFPVGAAMGATFDPELIEEVGRALAAETRAKGADVLLAPTVNIPRVPNAGRNFECFSEDPVLSGVVAAAYIRGLQAEGVGACIKHFVCNDQEHERFSISAKVDERPLREIYLEPFRIAVEESQPWAAMSAYNTINGITASENPLLDDVLRGEFGFDGVVISDWYGTYSPGVVASGLDLEMPGPARWMAAEHIREALASGAVDEEVINRKVSRLLRLIDRTGARHRPEPAPEVATEPAAHRQLARRVAAESMVLLKNDSALPVTGPQRIAVIGELAAATSHQGGGSSGVTPHRVVSILEGIEAAAPAGSTVKWAVGASAHRWPPAFDPNSIEHGNSARGFLAEYYAGPGFVGDPVRTLATTKSHLVFLGQGDEWVEHDNFSLRLSGRFTASTTGNHTFSVSAGGRVRVIAGGAIVIDAWNGGAVVLDAWDGYESKPQRWEMELAAGEELDLVVEYESRPGERKRWIGVGCEPPVPLDPIGEARALAADCDLAVVVVGLTPEWESEGFDRSDLSLPGEQDWLVREVAATQPSTVVVVAAGSPVEMPWLDRVGAVVQAWYGGQEVGHAVADVLFGNADPGGRLPVTFPRHSRQHPGLLNFPGEAGEVRYGEGVYVGYRGFDRLGLKPMFPFGHGLSYTTFALDEVAAEQKDSTLVVSGRLANVGLRSGSEVVQVFARDIGNVDRRLAGFAKVRLQPGEETFFEIPIGGDRLRWWNPDVAEWMSASGDIEFEIRGSFGLTMLRTTLP
jgi:beta-glucosidase